MGVIVDIGYLRVLHMDIEPPVHACKRSQSSTNLVGCNAVEHSDSRSGNAVLDVHPDRNAQGDIFDNAVRVMQIEGEAAFCGNDVRGEIICAVVLGRVGEEFCVAADMQFVGKTVFEQQRVRHKAAVMLKALAVGIRRAVDVQVVGIDAGDNRHKRAQVVETSVELIRLDDNKWAVAVKEQVRMVVFAQSAKESACADVRLAKQVGKDSAGGRFAVRSCHAERFFEGSDLSQGLCAFLDMGAV